MARRREVQRMRAAAAGMHDKRAGIQVIHRIADIRERKRAHLVRVAHRQFLKEPYCFLMDGHTSVLYCKTRA